MSTKLIGNITHSGGQVNFGGQRGIVGITAMGFGVAAVDGAGAFKGPVVVGDAAAFAPVFKQGTMMVSRRPGIDPAAGGLQLLPIVSIQNNVPFKTLPYDVLLGNMDTPVGVTFFTGNIPALGGFKHISGPTIKSTDALGQNFITVIKAHVEAFLEDIGIKNFTGVKMQNGVATDMGLVVEQTVSTNSAIQQGVDMVSAAATLNQTYSIANSKKPFDILHPTKEGHRLRYVCLEGPAAEVYVRGKLIESNVIELPDYWKGLIDPETITVNLTPIGSYQELFYEEADWGSRIKVMNAAGGPVKCSYTVYAERKDTEKNIPEYKGLTPDDYPGDNSEYRI